LRDGVLSAKLPSKGNAIVLQGSFHPALQYSARKPPLNLGENSTNPAFGL
jgi:hypothetical protein